MKKLLVWICVLALTAALFAGCAKRSSSESAPSLPVLTEEPSAAPVPGETDPAPAPSVPETADSETPEPAPDPETAEPAPDPEAPDPETAEPVPDTEAPAPETAEPIPDTEAPAPETETADVPVEIDPDVHPMLFRVTGANGQEMYLFGTIHVGDERTADAMNLVTPWLDECGALAVEFNIAAYERDMTAQTRDMMTFLLADGTTIEDHMDPALFARANDLVEEAGLFPAVMRHFNLAMWSQLVEQAALMTTCADLDFDGGMDRQLIAFCENAGIEIRDVESAEFQYGLLAGFPDELNLLMIRETLDHLDSCSESTHRLYEAWLTGDYDRILALVEEDDDSGDGAYTDEELALIADYNYQMLDARNLGMRDKAVEWLEAGDRVFFAVGAAHLVGDAGLVALLREAGYTVEQIEGASAR